MGRSERSGERLFFHALAAMVFAAVCAWSAAAIYGGCRTAEAPEAAPVAAEGGATGVFRGVLLRREEALPAGAFAGTERGARLSAPETGTESALYFPSCDGWEFLSPADAGRLTPESLEALLNAEYRPAPTPAPSPSPRLVYGFDALCAALFEGDAAPLPGPCRLRLTGLDEDVEARLLSVTADPLGRTLLLLRLTGFPEKLYEMRVVQGKIYD
jgi:hypothetical protein